MLNRQALNEAALNEVPRRVRIVTASAILAASAASVPSAVVEAAGEARVNVATSAEPRAWVDRAGHAEGHVTAQIPPPQARFRVDSQLFASAQAVASAWVERAGVAEAQVHSWVEADAVRHQAFWAATAESHLSADPIRNVFAEIAFDVEADFDPKDTRINRAHVEAIAGSWLDETSRIHAGGFVYIEGAGDLSAESGVNGVYLAYAEGTSSSAMSAKADKTHGGLAQADAYAEFRPKPVPGRGALVKEIYPLASVSAEPWRVRPGETHAETASVLSADGWVSRRGTSEADVSAALEATLGRFKGVRITFDAAVKADPRPWRVRHPDTVAADGYAEKSAEPWRIRLPELALDAKASVDADALHVHIPRPTLVAVEAAMAAVPMVDRWGHAQMCSHGAAETDALRTAYQYPVLAAAAGVDAAPRRTQFADIDLPVAADLDALALLNLTDPAPDKRRMTVSAQERVMAVPYEPRVMEVA